MDFVLDEMMDPWKDCRMTFERYESEYLEGRRLFYMLIGETGETFYKGKKVSATVTKPYDGRNIVVKLDIANLGMIDKSDFTGSEITEVKQGMVYLCTISDIDFQEFRIKLRLWKEENFQKFDF